MFSKIALCVFAAGLAIYVIRQMRSKDDSQQFTPDIDKNRNVFTNRTK